jgi:hypothetical protein
MLRARPAATTAVMAGPGRRLPGSGTAGPAPQLGRAHAEQLNQARP